MGQTDAQAAGRERPLGAGGGATLRTKQGGRSRPDSSFDADTWLAFGAAKSAAPVTSATAASRRGSVVWMRAGGGGDVLSDANAACFGRLHRGEP